MSPGSGTFPESKKVSLFSCKERETRSAEYFANSLWSITLPPKLATISPFEILETTKLPEPFPGVTLIWALGVNQL
jgi:hypothetical protein